VCAPIGSSKKKTCLAYDLGPRGAHMDRNARSRYEQERNAYLNAAEKTQFFDADSGIYKPRRYETRETHGVSSNAPLFFNAIPDVFTLAISLLSFFTLFVTFLAVFWYASVAEQQKAEMHDATAATGRSANAAQSAAHTAEKTLEFTMSVSRPLVSIHDVDVTPHEGGGINFSVNITNSGEIEATHFSAKCEIFVDDVRLPATGISVPQKPATIGSHSPPWSICGGGISPSHLALLTIYVHATYNGLGGKAYR
jgi:hypothetical protein